MNAPALPKSIKGRHAVVLLAGFAGGLVLAAIVLTEALALAPCHLCIFQRVLNMAIAVLHYLGALVITAFMCAHIYLGTTGHKVSTHFKMMVTGWHEH